jgi:quercetin dioxygenase-like cupin family protein
MKTPMKTMFASLAEIEEQRAASGKPYREFLRVPAMSAGLYVLPAGGTDHQKPHREDEIYYVIRGRARFQAGPEGREEGREEDREEDREVCAGSVIFVAAEVGHRFYEITEELTVLVLFAPAES